MQEIVNTESHTLAVDTAKNRIYFTIHRDGFLWSSTFTQDWGKAKRLVFKGFTVLTDASRMQSISKNWVETSVKLQKMLIPEGLAGTAEILSESVAEKLRIHHLPRILRGCCYIKEEIFTDRKLAEAWLDRIGQAISPEHVVKYTLNFVVEEHKIFSKKI